MEKYGLPDKVRTDHCRDNIEVWGMMHDEQEGENCVMFGVQHTMNILRGCGVMSRDQLLLPLGTFICLYKLRAISAI